MAEYKEKKRNSKMTINFDMDGTIANLYGVENWLEYLINEDTTPYEIAKPRLNMQALARVLNRLSREGYTINIISWGAKLASESFNQRIALAKVAWLAEHLASVEFTNIFVVPYGTPKQSLASGILFDDEEPNRTAWGKGAYDVDNIIEMLKSL